ncbi:efflux RND transporter permease subunit [Comamonas sp. JC664]|uniref:efflux RND transporter permease subunit n=1 Tax=Comamonas sp. JC664 TaxID=2801917 RepID=UPI00174AE9F8|nr:efflux RND transporter permease subunit [Comamonas sp. JC664]MBL0695376.1 efflux RND transporter permease subunit [Comamonas sp. JC664]GHG87702.1 nodulation protein NolG [Comamonas sp. KCTC 72670]
MLLSDVSIRRPVFTAMLSLCLVVLGLMGLGRLGTDLYPDVSFPVVVINTVYKGAGPGEIETQVVKPIEDAVAGISGVDKIHSFSRENVGIVVVQFKLSAPLDRAVQDVRDKVAGIASKLPQDADAPVVGRLDLSAMPILTYAVSADLPSQELRRLIDDRIKPALAQLEGAAEVRVTGGDTREVQIDIELDKARAAGVSPLGIAQRVAQENLDLPAGRLQLGASEMTVRSLGQFQNVEEIRSLPVARSATGAQVRLGEIATVTDGVAERRTLARLNGQDAIILEVVKQPGSNTVSVSEAVQRVMTEMAPAVGQGFQATLLIDQSDLIRENAHEVWVALVFGGAMAVLIILVFLLDVRGTFISSLALPTSVIGTFFVMYVLDYTLNQMTLLGLSLAIGLLIDDAVVVREAITHRLEKGEDPVSAASNGTRDVGLAVLATTLSLVAVFVPVAFMPGIVGQFFRQFGITISVAVLISLFISFTLDPMMSARLAKQRKPGEVRKENAVAAALRRFLDGTERAYESILRWVLSHKWTTMGLTVLLLVVSFGGASGLGVEFMPAEDRSQFFVDLTLPDSASLQETEARTADAEVLLRQIPEVTNIYAIVGKDGDVNKSRLRVLTLGKDARARGIPELKEEARALLEPGLIATRVNLSDPPVLEGMGDYYPIMVRITGPDLDRVNAEAERVAGILRDLPGTADVRVESNPPKPEMQVLIDRARAADVDLNAAALATQLRLAIGGDVVAKLREGTTETDIRVRLAEKDRATPERVRQLEVFTPQGLRPLTDVATVARKNGPSLIEHENRERQIAVYSQLGRGAALGDIARQLKERVAAQPLPPGYALVYDGMMKNMDEQNDAFGAAFGLAFVFIYMVLASQFESYKHPLTIMASLPLALVGALLGLVVTGYHLSMGAMIGVILLMGLVTKNAILLIDGALQNLREGDSVDEALLKAGPRRLRPILMTSAAMAIAMVPTAVGTGTGSEFRAPMAISVIGGVITSTFLTLLVVPVVFAGMERLGFKRRRPPSDGTPAVPLPEPEPKHHQAA